MSNVLVGLGAINMFLAVALGAFGAHVLRDHLSASALQVYQTGIQYHLVHAIALLVLGLLAVNNPARAITWSGWLLQLGIILFCGSLYLLATTGSRSLGIITPLGGLCFLAGWLLLAAHALAGF